MARSALIALALLAVGCGGASSEPGSKTANKAAEAKSANAESAGTEKKGRQEITLGKADAPVTIIEYASPTCPHCATFHETVFPELKAKFIDTGVAKLIFREIPTPPQNMAFVGSLLARCAAEKRGNDAYFMVLSTLFKTGHTQDMSKSWIFGANKLGDMQKIAGQAGMDQTEFEACMKRQDLVDLIVANSKEAGEKYNISGTPSFVINGKVSSARTIDDFAKAIEEARASKTKL
jgi:protein-disulfide isomerase